MIDTQISKLKTRLAERDQLILNEILLQSTIQYGFNNF